MPLDQMPDDFQEGRKKALAALPGAPRRVLGAVQDRRRRDPLARRAVRHRLGTPRQPAHRQPAPWPLGPTGRSRREPLLPESRRRSHAPVRHRRPQLRDGPGVARRRGHRGPHGHQGDRAGTDHGGDEERRDPQERPQVRRGDERAAQGHLQAPRPDPRR